MFYQSILNDDKPWLQEDEQIEDILDSWSNAIRKKQQVFWTDKMTTLNYISARDTTGVQRWKEKKPLVEARTRNYLSTNTTRVTMLSKERKIPRSSISCRQHDTVLYNLTWPQNVWMSKKPIWCYLLKGDIWKLSVEVKQSSEASDEFTSSSFCVSLRKGIHVVVDIFIFFKMGCAFV